MNKAVALASESTPPQSLEQISKQVDEYLQAARWADAKHLLQILLKLSPRNPGFLQRMSVVCNALNEVETAIEWLLKAIKEDLNNPDYHFMLGILYFNATKFDEAIAAYGQAIAHRPTFAEAHSNLGDVFCKKARFDEAIQSYQTAISLMPSAGQIYNNMGLALQRLGRSFDAIASFDRAQELEPRLVTAASNGLLASLYYHGYTAKQVFERHLEFARRFEDPLKVNWRPHTNERSTNRRLRLGYVSADLHNHSVANFAEPIITHHDKERFEVFFYYNNNYCDAVTARFQAAADGWRICTSWSDAQLSEAIRTDKIDILFDLSGHTGGNRLLTFARKPAPIQITWIGYPGTTGLSAMDYRFTDDNIDPPGTPDAFDTEKLVRLPATYPFQPPDESPPVSPLPALTASVFTVAYLGNMAKLNEKVIATWSRILLALPHARLLLGNAGNQSTQNWLLGVFAQHGIGTERLLLHSKIDLAQILKLSSQIDIALDTFPYNGATASMFGLWMGVPVVTLRGDRTVARLGTSILSRFDLTQFIANSESQYVDIVLQWAAGLPALSALRKSLRGRMEGIQDDPDQFRHAVERALIDMWVRWCERSF